MGADVSNGRRGGAPTAAPEGSVVPEGSELPAPPGAPAAVPLRILADPDDLPVRGEVRLKASRTGHGFDGLARPAAPGEGGREGGSEASLRPGRLSA